MAENYYKMLDIYQAGPVVKGKISAYGTPVYFTYRPWMDKVTYSGEDEDGCHINAQMLNDKYGVEYAKTGEFIRKKATAFINKNK